jgi:hypothetical protein
MGKIPLIIAHRDSVDGFTAAWVFRRFKGEAEFVFAGYGEAPPPTAGRDVWLLGFSYPRDVMLKDVILPSLRTTVIEHHKLAEAELFNILQDLRHKYNVQRTEDRVIFDAHRSGAGITFDTLELELNKRKGFKAFRPGGSRSVRLVDYVEDFDLGRFILPKAREVTHYILSQTPTFAEWDEMARMSIDEIAKKGEAVRAHNNSHGEERVLIGAKAPKAKNAKAEVKK